MYPYKIQLVQQLIAQDFQMQLESSRALLNLADANKLWMRDIFI